MIHAAAAAEIQAAETTAVVIHAAAVEEIQAVETAVTAVRTAKNVTSLQ